MGLLTTLLTVVWNFHLLHMAMFMFLTGEPEGYTHFSGFLCVAAFEECVSVLKIKYTFQFFWVPSY